LKLHRDILQPDNEAAGRKGRRRFPGDCGSRLAKSIAVLAIAGLNLACPRSYYSIPPERATELGNMFDTLSPEQLGFVRDWTNLDDAIQILRERGMTHVAENTNAPEGGRGISALTADFQHLIHIFRGRRYEQSIRLDLPAGELPMRYLLRVADYDGGLAIVALARDAAGFEPARLAIIPYSTMGAGEVSFADLSDLERRHNGMQDPIFVGYSLQDGITFIARDNEGVPWNYGYIISWDGSALRKRPVAFSELMMCDCIRGWAEGQ
jgi:hypothetical protein